MKPLIGKVVGKRDYFFKQKVARINYRGNSKTKVSWEFKFVNWLKHFLFCFMLNSNLAYYSLIKSSVDKNRLGQSIQNGPKKICGRQPLKNLKEYGLSKGCLPQILINTFLNTLSQIVGVLDYSETKTFQGKIRGKNIFPKKLKVKRESNIAISLKANCHRRKKLIKLQNFSSDIFFLWLFLPLNYSRCSFVTFAKTSE